MRVILVVLFMGLFANQVVAQNEQPILKSEPVTESRQDQSAAAGQDRAGPKYETASDIAPLLQGIEAAIRDSITHEDKAERKRQQEHEIRDLNAQEDMALWAKRMTWATGASLLLTFSGLVLIGFTLRHTRRAADYAKEMVLEAGKTTIAAEAAVSETRRIGEAQVRAYVSCVDGSFVLRDKHLICDIRAKNFGASPTKGVHVRARAHRVIGDGATKNMFSAWRGTWMFGIQPTLYDRTVIIFEDNQDTAEIFAQSRSDKKVSIEVELSWRDVFDKDQDIVQYLSGFGKAAVDGDGATICAGDLKPIGSRAGGDTSQKA